MHIYNTMYFDRNIDLSEKIKMAKKSEGNFSSYALNEEMYFSEILGKQNHQSFIHYIFFLF